MSLIGGWARREPKAVTIRDWTGCASRGIVQSIGEALLPAATRSKHMSLQFNEAADATLVWANLDPASLPPALAKQYDAYRTAYAHAKAAREAFEQSFRAAVVAPSGKQAVLGYRF